MVKGNDAAGGLDGGRTLEPVALSRPKIHKIGLAHGAEGCSGANSL